MNGVGAEGGKRDRVVCVGESEIGSFRCCVGAWRSMMRPTTKKPHAERKRERGCRHKKPSKKESKEHNVKSVCRWLSVLILLFCVVPSTPRTSPQHQICMYRLPTAFAGSSIHSLLLRSLVFVHSAGVVCVGGFAARIETPPDGPLASALCSFHLTAFVWVILSPPLPPPPSRPPTQPPPPPRPLPWAERRKRGGGETQRPTRHKNDTGFTATEMMVVEEVVP